MSKSLHVALVLPLIEVSCYEGKESDTLINIRYEYRGIQTDHSPRQPWTVNGSNSSLYTEL